MLARLATRAALDTDGVVAMTNGRLRRWSTPDGDDRIDGAVAVAAPNGRVDVTLHVEVEFVPLHPLAQSVREAVRASATSAGVSDDLGAIDIAIEALYAPEELRS